MQFTENKHISLIVAYAENMAIGKGNDLLWHISDDLKRFKALTTGHCIIMGRKTYESFPKRPLPNRRNIVITRNPNPNLDGCETVHSLEEAIHACPEGEEIFIIGGASVYEQSIGLVQTMYVTKVFGNFEAEKFFPTFDAKDFAVVSQSEVHHDEKSGLDYQYLEYRRIRA